jgi:hypothetical protein
MRSVGFTYGYSRLELSKMAGRCGSAAPLCGRAPPFRAATALFSYLTAPEAEPPVR